MGIKNVKWSECKCL